MEPENLTVRLLQEIRDEIRRSSERSDERFAKMDERFEKMDRRFEVIETTLRDLAQQMVMLEDHERRLSDLEKRGPH
ncbi:MAG: hypothetical protein IT380_01470 [Myxococcales bacterium]|nr:hypothetical protein [Myxococcales bacterium]